MLDKKKLTPIALVSIFFLMLGLSFAAVPLYDLFCRVTGFGGTTQNASQKELPKIVINQDYKVRFDTNSNGDLAWKFYPEKNTLDLKPGQVHNVKFFVENDIPNLFINDPDTDETTIKQKNFYEDVKFPNYDDLDDFSSLIHKSEKSMFAKQLDQQLPHSSAIKPSGHVSPQ